MQSAMKYLLIVIFAFFGAAATAQEIPVQYLQTAANNNPGLKASFNEYLAALEVIPQVKTLPDPRLAFGYFIQPVETRVGPQQARISVDQMFPWFGQLKANEDVAAAQAKVKYEQFEENKSRLFFEVRSAYYDLYVSQKAVDILYENLAILNTFRDLTMIRVEAGIASSVDQLRLEMEIADLENQLAGLQDRVTYEQIVFNNLLYVSAEDPVFFPDTLSSPELMLNEGQILDSIRKNNHLLAGLEHELSVVRNKETVARKSGSPDINLGFDYLFIGNSDNPNLESGSSGKDAIVFPRIGLTLPLYRKKYKSMVQETVYRQEAVNEKKAAQVNTLETLFARVMKEYRDASRRLELYRRQTGLAYRAMEILQTDYAHSNRDFEEVLRMEKRVLNYALELERARADLNASMAFIQYLSGN